MQAVVRTAVGLSLAVATSLGSGACTGTEDSTTDASSTTAIVTMTLSPDPATAIAAENTDYKWQGSFNIALQETAGVGVTVTGVNIYVQEASNGIVLSTGASAVFKAELQNTSNRLDAKGTLTVGVKVSYTLPNGGREALVTVQVGLQDDNANTGTFSDTVTVK
jgi:hypothetical protein